MPYLSTTVAPPSYQDTLLADQIVQQDSAPAYSLEEEPVTDGEGGEEAEDVGSNSSMHQLLLPEQEAEMRTCDRGMNRHLAIMYLTPLSKETYINIITQKFNDN